MLGKTIKEGVKCQNAMGDIRGKIEVWQRKEKLILKKI